MGDCKEQNDPVYALNNHHSIGNVAGFSSKGERRDMCQGPPAFIDYKLARWQDAMAVVKVILGGQ